ncbi:MAG: phosphotransferase [Chloroflexaceae bacterium]
MTSAPIRVLIVDNLPEFRAQYAALVRDWGYEPVVVDVDGAELPDQALRVAAEQRCPLALVDLRLVEDTDQGDISGLELVHRLPYTKAIVITGYDNTPMVRLAIQKYGAASFVGKGEAPEVLRAELNRVADSQCLRGNGPRVHWQGGLSSAAVRDKMFPDQPGIPADEPEALIRLLFNDKPWVRLTMISDSNDGAGAEQVSPSVNASLRRKSRVFVAEIAGERALRVVKLARTEKIERERENYRRYVEGGIEALRRPELTGDALLWDMGAIAYRLVGFEHLAEGRGQVFTRFYRRTVDPATIVAPLRDFFSYAAWGDWYRSPHVQSLQGTLVEVYDRSWDQALTRLEPLWRAQPLHWRLEPLAITLPHPQRWFVEQRQRCEQLGWLRQAITHGDLHGDNLFADRQTAWPIDFERTGYGPLLRDFVELVQDVTTRIAVLHAEELPLVYELALALCGPQAPCEPMRATRAILAHAEARKCFLVVQALQELAAARAAYDDRREYLWGLLCNHLFVSGKLVPESVRWQRTMLFAAVICQRLDRWEAAAWPPLAWPQVEWAAPQSLEG